MRYCNRPRFFGDAAKALGVETLSDYLHALASDAPTPGGGSAATMVAASGAALVAMVARISAGNPKYAASAELCRDLVRRADALRADLLSARVRDESAFDQVVAAQALPKSTDDEKAARAARLEAALTAAAAEPLHGARLALDVLRLAAHALAIPNRNLVSDVGCAAEFASAALHASAYNVRINHRFMKDEASISGQAHALERYEREASALLEGVRRDVNRSVRR